MLIEDIKSKLQENFYKIEYCTYIYVNQKIYKHATKPSKDRETLKDALVNRGTLALDLL